MIHACSATMYFIHENVNFLSVIIIIIMMSPCFQDSGILLFIPLTFILIAVPRHPGAK
jgi:hypothetical protein